METFETRLKARTAAIRAKIAETMEQAKDLHKAIETLNVEADALVQQSMEERKQRAMHKDS